MSLRRAILATLAAFVLAGCARPKPAERIVLITLDTTRADRLGCYGYGEAENPEPRSLRDGEYPV